MDNNQNEIEIEIDVTYGIAESVFELKLDLYKPADTGANTRRSVILFFHGGGWETGDKGSMLGKGSCTFFAKHGFVCASVNYRLSGLATFPAQLDDVQAAVSWIRSQANRYRLDPDRIGIWGHSAGGHLAALLGAVGALDGNESCRVRAVATSAAPVDLLQMGGWHNGPDSPESRLVGGPLLENRQLAETANPIRYITDAFSTPYLIIHGTRDEIVPYSQAELLYEAIPNATLVRIKGGDHDYTGGNLFWGELYELLLAFFHKHLRAAPESPEVARQRRAYMEGQVRHFSRESC
ncbi:alpha/beta hydrolase [Paenibacillus koleovorans]|uniref:alpha/beta hydrolase n=1 Tax=Paenibacillus koleovorans TaxID=121608 RepID=UPI000FDAEE73|nr:alpha/beta hydrolase [Paenibacillus koleovorans]